MKKLFVFMALAAAATAGSAQIIQSSVIEDGGTGPYKAIMAKESGLPDYTVYRPGDLKAAVASEDKLPVILFGNGGCANTSNGFKNFLTEIASHGYVVIAIGEYVDFVEQQAVVQGPPANPGSPAFPETPGNPDRLDTRNMPPMAVTNPVNPDEVPEQKAAALGLFEAMDWLAKQNSDRNSAYYQMIATDQVAAMGQSCGGIQALVLGTSGDDRIKTVIALNSGVTSPGDFLSNVVTKDELKKLQTPIAYFIGGESDIAYKNALDDYSRISHVPVVMANYDVGHGGTYREEHGGTFAGMALAWLDYVLKNKAVNEAIFTEGKLDAFAGWTLLSKNF